MSYHTLLPPEAQAALRKAAATKGDPFVRAKAIDEALRKIKRQYPDKFVVDKNEPLTTEDQ